MAPAPAGEVSGEAEVEAEHLRLDAVRPGIIEGVEQRMTTQLSGISHTEEVRLAYIAFTAHLNWSDRQVIEGSSVWDSATPNGDTTMRFSTNITTTSDDQQLEPIRSHPVEATFHLETEETANEDDDDENPLPS